MSCDESAKKTESVKTKQFDLSGHRGARGLCPENTLEAFSRALTVGVTTLEMDAAITNDDVIAVYHDITLDQYITRGPDGQWIEGDPVPVRSLTFTELQKFDVGRIRPGSEYAKTFTEQRQLDGVRIPSLESVIDLVRKSGLDHVALSIETKIDVEKPDLSVKAQDFAERLVVLLRKKEFANRANIQSFDWSVLQHVQKIAPEIPTVYLTAAKPDWYDTVEIGQPGASKWTGGIDVDDHGGSVAKAVNAAGGKIWSPYYKDIDSKQIEVAHGLGMTVVVWTINEPKEMAKFIDLGVDGIITDYPDRLRLVLEQKGKPLPKASSATAKDLLCK